MIWVDALLKVTVLNVPEHRLDLFNWEYIHIIHHMCCHLLHICEAILKISKYGVGISVNVMVSR